MNNNQTQYVITNQQGDHYQEFDHFRGIPRFTSKVQHAWFLNDEVDAKLMISDIIEWTWEHKRKDFILGYSLVEFVVTKIK